jgi:hypothetical protein
LLCKGFLGYACTDTTLYPKAHEVSVSLTPVQNRNFEPRIPGNKEEYIMHDEELPSASEPSGPDTLISRLTADGADAKAVLDKFLSGLDLLPYLEAEPSDLKRWLGHPTLIGKLRAGIWQTEPLKGSKTGPIFFPNPARHFDVHFELQVQLWKRRMSLFLHYETNPYHSEDKLRSRAASASVAQYYQRRDEFIREFTVLGEVPGFQISPGTVQIGKAVYDFDGKTVEQVAAWLQPVIDEVGCHVNEALHKVDQKRRLAADAVNGTDTQTATT